jgi:hypothetical protein
MHAGCGTDQTELPSRGSMANTDEEHRYAIRAALAAGAMTLLAIFGTIGVAVVGIVLVGESAFTGSEMLFAFAMAGVVLIVFLAFVFQRLLRIRAEKTGTGSVDIDVGDRT